MAIIFNLLETFTLQNEDGIFFVLHQLDYNDQDLVCYD